MEIVVALLPRVHLYLTTCQTHYIVMLPVGRFNAFYNYLTERLLRGYFVRTLVDE